MKTDTHAIPHLCGGILFDLILEARKPRQKSRNKLSGGSDGFSMPCVYAGLCEIVTGEDLLLSAGKTIGKCVTNYRKCIDSTGDYVPFTQKSTQAAFHSLYISNRDCLYERVASFSEKYVAKDKCVWLVSAIMETMQKDTAIPDDTEIAVSLQRTMQVSDLHTADKIYFVPFFLSVLHYVVMNCPDCESGIDTFRSWYVQNGTNSEWKFTSNIGNSIPPMVVDTDFAITKQSDTIPADIKEIVHKFSKEYYHLIVTCNEDVFENGYVSSTPYRSVAEYNSPPEIVARCSDMSPSAIAELLTFPAIICNENTEQYGKSDPDQYAVYAYLTRIVKSGKSIKIAFRPIAKFRQQILCDKKNAIYFDLDMDSQVTTLNHSAWSVHRVNLFEAFEEAGLGDLPKPE